MNTLVGCQAGRSHHHALFFVLLTELRKHVSFLYAVREGLRRRNGNQLYLVYFFALSYSVQQIKFPRGEKYFLRLRKEQHVGVA